MQKYQNNVQTLDGRAIVGASVTVTEFPGGAPATVYNSNGSGVITQPILTNGDGEFAFYAANGRYQLQVIGGGISVAQTITDVILFDPDDAGGVITGSELSNTVDVDEGDALVGVKRIATGATGSTLHDWIEGQPLSILDFGANGGADDTAAIQAAINAASNQELRIPNGTFIASALSIPSSIRIVGEGPGSILKQKGAANNFFIQLATDGITVEFSNITLDQNNSNQTTGSGKFLFNSTRAGITGSPLWVSFSKVWLKDFCEGAIRIVGDRNSGTREILHVNECRFTGGTESESSVYDTFTIFAADASELVVVDSDFDHGLTLTKQGIPAISVAGVTTPSAAYTEVTIRNNRFKGYGRFTVGSGIGVIDCYVWADKADISGNKFVGSYVVPIRAKTNARDMVIIGNIMSEFNNPGTASLNGGISIVAATLPTTEGRYVISGNVIDSPLYRGIEVSDGGAVPEQIIISSNVIRSPGDVGIALLGCKGFSIEGNNIKSAGQQGVTFSTCQGSGRISGNIIDGAAQTGIQSIGSQLSLDLQVHENFINAATIAGVTVENVRNLSLQDNIVKDIVLSGSQRGYRVGGSTGIENGQVKNNFALGTFATAQYSIITAGFTVSCFERGNSWNAQERYLSAAPTTGTWARGDIVWHSSPAAGGNIGFVCTTAGTPGTWKTFGTIAA